MTVQVEEAKQSTQPAATKVESSELRGVKAGIWIAVMIVGYLIAAFYVSSTNTPATLAINEHIAFLEFAGAAVTWAVSKILPDGLLTAGRTFVAAVVINAGLVAYGLMPLFK